MPSPRTPLAALIGALCALAFAVPAQAEELRRLAEGVHLLIGSDGNVLILAGPAGVLIVDDQRSRDHDETVAAVAKVSPEPVRLVVNTHWHLDHAGDNEAFARAGAVIVAQREVRTRLASDQFMAAYNRTVPASPAVALPTVLYDDALEVRFGGQTVLLRHAPNAHTDGDTIVRLVEANVLHLGDLYFNGLFPFIDTSSRGDIDGLIAAVDAALAMSDDKTVIVPAHGEVATRKDLRTYRDMLSDLAGKVRARKALGETLAQVQAARLTAAYALDGDADRLVAAIYETLSP